MKRDALTPKETELLALIREHRRMVIPTVRELATLANVKSPATIQQRLTALRRKGWLPYIGNVVE